MQPQVSKTSKKGRDGDIFRKEASMMRVVHALLAIMLLTEATAYSPSSSIVTPNRGELRRKALASMPQRKQQTSTEPSSTETRDSAGSPQRFSEATKVPVIRGDLRPEVSPAFQDRTSIGNLVIPVRSYDDQNVCNRCR